MAGGTSVYLRSPSSTASRSEGPEGSPREGPLDGVLLSLSYSRVRLTSPKSPTQQLPQGHDIDSRASLVSARHDSNNMSHIASQQTFRLNHTMFRIKDPKISLEFYQDILGMKLLHKMEVESAKFTNYFLGFPGSNQDSKSSSPLHREGVVELCHNWGTESDPDFSGYHNGNKSPQGFGHLAITCDDVEKTCAYLEEKQVKFQKRLKDGSMKEIAFIQDPDGYWIEILGNTFFD
ncbi:Lactoylglutathione lyase [Puccinia graminis f. sp. tritici]|uniref:lactoylglutathione lyase n=2 Tax=Puccinia graminis f. sp. tritici TaxID=56615 RepID=A0A5B0NZT6_PUCGR|nr:Lactoylglutathione lyase [Puccinia graminis f. sp. tritici]